MRGRSISSAAPLLVSVVALGAVIVGSLLVSSRGGSGDVGSSGSPTSPTSAPTAASPAGPPVAVGGIAWTPYVGPGTGSPKTVVPGGPGYVGLCSNSHYGKNGNYADQVYCESPDGITWTEASFAGLQNAKGEHLELHSVARGPQGLVLVGSRTYDVQRDLVVPAVFTSPDGRTWSESPPGGPNYEVVNGPAGFVGIAWSYAAGTSVMQSADGVSWRESDLDGSGSAGYGPAAELSATSAAYFIGVGSGIPGFPHPGLYRSVDGLHWVQVNSEGARVVEAPDGSLLSQIPGLPNPVNYILTRSVDGGATWEPVDVQVTGMTLDEDDSAIRELMRVGNVVLGRSHYSVLASVDGIRWQVASPSAITDNAFWLVPLGDAIRLDIGEDEVWIGKPQ